MTGDTNSSRQVFIGARITLESRDGGWESYWCQIPSLLGGPSTRVHGPSLMFYGPLVKVIPLPGFCLTSSGTEYRKIKFFF